MNINKNTTIVSVALAMLFSAVSVMGAVTAISADFTTFDNTRASSAVWRADVRYGLTDDSYKEFGMNNGSTLSYTHNHNVWVDNYNKFDPNTVTMGYNLLFDGTELTITLGDVYTQNHLTTYSGTSSQTITPSGNFTTLWFGVESDVNSSNLSFNMINTVIDGVPVDSLHANGVGFSGEYFAINEGQAFSVVGEVQWENPGGNIEYAANGANFRIFGNNTLESIPEPSSALLIGVAGFLILLRRQRG